MLKSKLIAAAALALAMTAPVSAQVVLTISSEQTTTYVRNFNPFNQTSARATTKDFIYEPLAIFNRLAGAKWEYRLAESFELADDLKSISFTLRDGLKWSDGEPLTVDDVVFTYDYLMKFPALDFNSVSKLMESVEKVDERTVRFNLMHAQLAGRRPPSSRCRSCPSTSGRMSPIRSPSPTRPRSARAR